MARELGDKLGPRLASLVRQHTLASRLSLAPVEARIAAAGTQHVIDRAGRETADHYRAVIGELLKVSGDLPPWLEEYLRETASGDHQWRSIAGVLGVTGASSVIGTVLNNFLADPVARLVRTSPGLNLDVASTAAATAAGILTYEQGAYTASGWGYEAGIFNTMRDLAQTIPGAPDLHDMHNRGLIDGRQLHEWLTRLALPPDLIGPVEELGRQLLSPADAALAVLRGNMTEGEGRAIAAANGMHAADFDVLIGNTGEPPAIEEMLMLHRRGKIDTPTLDRAIRQSRVRDEWIPAIHDLSVEPPGQADVLEALVQGEISEGEARRRFAEAGGDPTYFDVAFRTRANSPAPGQLAEMLNRGIIAEHGGGGQAVTYEQGFREGRWKDKWLPAFRRLAVYLPPPREIATLVKESGLTQDQAITLWEEHGMTPELAHAYWTAAHYQRTSAVHQLTVSEIERLYFDQAITAETATGMLEGVGWTATDAGWLLDLTDIRRERAELERAIAKVRALYLARKIDKPAASSAMAALELPASQVAALMKTWDLERAESVRTLTPAEYEDAFYYKLMSPEDAAAHLVDLGYSPHDAWLKVSIKAKGPIDGFPDPGGA